MRTLQRPTRIHGKTILGTRSRNLQDKISDSVTCISFELLVLQEDHDGYFLRCIECGESFRSKKQQINHTLRNCKAGAEKGQEVISLNLPLQINVLANFSKLYEQAQANTTNVDIISYIREKGDSLKEVEIKPDYRTQIEVKTHSSDKEKNSTGKESHKPKDMDHKPAEADNRENESNCGQGMSLKVCN